MATQLNMGNTIEQQGWRWASPVSLCNAGTILDVLHDALLGYAPDAALLVALDPAAMEKIIETASADVQHLLYRFDIQKIVIFLKHPLPP